VAREEIRSGRGIRRLVFICGIIPQLVRENDRRLQDESNSGDEGEEPEVTQPPQDPEEVAQRLVLLSVIINNHRVMSLGVPDTIAIGVRFKHW
jgi:hypothetical protein